MVYHYSNYAPTRLYKIEMKYFFFEPNESYSLLEGLANCDRFSFGAMHKTRVILTAFCALYRIYHYCILFNWLQRFEIVIMNFIISFRIHDVKFKCNLFK